MYRSFIRTTAVIIAIGFLFPAIGISDNDDKPAKADVAVEKKGGIVYKSGDDFELKCDIYLPETTGKRPAIIIVHGGGWRSGTKMRYQSHSRQMAKRGYVVMCINYRHAPTWKFTDQVADVKTAVRWLKHHVDEYSINSKRIGIWGYSAGGHLAAMVGTTDQNDGLEGDLAGKLKKYDSRVHAVAIGGAPCDIESYPIDSRVLFYWLKSTRRNNPERYQRASPLTYVTQDDPPFFIFHGGQDELVAPELSKALHEKLKQAGVRSEFKQYDKYGHFSMFWYQVGLSQSIDFFDSVLK